MLYLSWQTDLRGTLNYCCNKALIISDLEFRFKSLSFASQKLIFYPPKAKLLKSKSWPIANLMADKALNFSFCRYGGTYLQLRVKLQYNDLSWKQCPHYQSILDYIDDKKYRRWDGTICSKYVMTSHINFYLKLANGVFKEKEIKKSISMPIIS